MKKQFVRKSIRDKRIIFTKGKKSQTGLKLLQSNNPGQKMMKHGCKGPKDHSRISQAAQLLNNKEIFSNSKTHGI